MTALLQVSELNAYPMAQNVIRKYTLEEKIENAVHAIKSQVINGKQLVVACSFGKDSCVTLALALKAMQELMREGLPVPTLHIMHSNTLLENPIIEKYNAQMIKALGAYKKVSGLPLKIWVASPGLSNNYMVNLIGGRTVATLPDNDRKCQQMMKKAPLDQCKRYIRNYLKKELGQAYTSETLLTLMGTRFVISSTRFMN